MNNIILTESKEFKDFYEIPSYSNYLINRDGKIYNKTRQTFLTGSKNPDGYFNYRLTSDIGVTYTWGLHRLLAFVFKHPGCDIKNLVVNHISAIKSNNHLDNLEWVTYQGNAEHAGSLGITTKCSPISVRDVLTGEVEKFPSIVECARKYGVSKDYINWRSKKGEHYIFPEGKQYRLSHEEHPWFIPENISLNFIESKLTSKVMVRYVLTGVVQSYKKISDLAYNLNIPNSTLSQWLKYPNQPILPGLIQVKYSKDDTPWREVKYPTLELNSFIGIRPVIATNEKTGDVKTFSSAKECCLSMNIKPSALNYRLKSDGKRVFSDGYSYKYCSSLI